MTDSDAYYRQRIEEELAAADSANDAGISRIHRDMAQRYRNLIEPPRGKAPNVEPGTVFG